ncbi:MAG: prolyl oligopeptidase family serine peptidase [Pannonibacter sp.]
MSTILLLAACAHAETHPLDVDDMMKVEGFGSALADPAGRWFVYEQLRPYEQSEDFSFRTYAFEKTGHQIWRVDVSGNEKAERLPGLDPVPHSYVQDFSPTGRFLSVMTYDFGDLTLGAYDMNTETVKYFGPTPAYGRSGDHNPVWVSSTDLVYAAMPEGALPPVTSVRAHTGRTLTRRWEDAWTGLRATADEVRTIARVDPDGPEEGSLVRVNALSGQAEILSTGLFADLRLAGNGRLLAALRVSKPRPLDPGEAITTDPRRYALVVFDLGTGKASPLAEDLEFFPYSITWAPDSRWLTAFGWKRGDRPEAGRFHLVDTTSGEVRTLEHEGLDLTSERERGWLQRPDRAVFWGEGLAIFARPIPEGEDQSPRFTPRNLRDPSLARPDWYAISPSAAPANLTAGLPGVSAVPADAGNGYLTVAASDGVYRIGRDGSRVRLTPDLAGPVSVVTPGRFATRSSVARPDFNGTVLVKAGAGDDTLMLLLDVQKGEAKQIRIPGQLASPMASAFSAGSFLLRDEDGPVSSLHIARAQAPGAIKPVARINAHLSKVSLGNWQAFSYTVVDPEGAAPPTLLESCVLLPSGYTQGRPVALVVDVYPDVAPGCAPRSVQIPYADPHTPYLWAGRGYAYVRLATPSALIRTQEGPIAGLDEVTEAGVHALIQSGVADPERLILHGYSQGGVSALYVASQSDLFQAVIAKNSWADLFSHYFGPSGVFTALYPEHLGGEFGRYDTVTGTDFGIGSTPFDAPQLYFRNSPVYLAPRIQVPVLLMHSDMDIFPMTQFDEMFGALKRAGKDARYVRYWGEGHGPSSPANIRDMWTRTDAFLNDHGLGP